MSTVEFGADPGISPPRLPSAGCVHAVNERALSVYSRRLQGTWCTCHWDIPVVSLDFSSISTPLPAHTYTIVCKGWSVPTHETELMGGGAKVTLFRKKNCHDTESEEKTKNSQLIAADGVGFIGMIVCSDLQRFPRQVRIIKAFFSATHVIPNKYAASLWERLRCHQSCPGMPRHFQNSEVV